MADEVTRDELNATAGVTKKPEADAGNLALQMLREESLRHRLRGWSIARISKAMNQPRRRVSRWIDDELDNSAARRTVDVEKVRELELARLDEILSAIWEKGVEGVLANVDRILKVSERRCKLLGLDAPEKLSVEAPGIEAVLSILEEAKKRRDRVPLDRLAGISIPPPLGMRSVEN